MKTIPREMAFIVNLWTLSTVTTKKIEAYLGSLHGLGFTEYMVLFHLQKAHNKSMRRIDLAQNLGLTASGVTRLISPMEKIGLVQKEVNPRDARVSLVKLSRAGETILKDATKSLEETSKQLLKGVKSEKLMHTLDVFKSIDSALYI